MYLEDVEVVFDAASVADFGLEEGDLEANQVDIGLGEGVIVHVHLEVAVQGLCTGKQARALVY